MQMHKNEVTTGILVLATLGVLTTVLIVIGMPGLIKPMHTYRIYFDNAKGIRPGAPVLLAGREVGKVKSLHSPVPRENRPPGHPNYEVSIDVQVAETAQIYQSVTVHLTQQGLMGQPVIDFVQGDATTGRVEDHTEFVGERIPDLSESMANHMQRLMGPESDLALTIKNAKIFMETLNNSKIPEVIKNTEQFTDTLKREPWRLLWPSTKVYGDEVKDRRTKKK
jgi:ABC-type transporter Mla subunit MlaD